MPYKLQLCLLIGELQYFDTSQHSVASLRKR